jgi:hypothetical protein
MNHSSAQGGASSQGPVAPAALLGAPAHALRNRLHALLDRQHGLELPQCSNLFGVRGMGHLRRLELPEPDGSMLREELALLALLNSQIKEQEKRSRGSGDPSPAEHSRPGTDPRRGHYCPK